MSNEFWAGCYSGVVQTFIGHPLDTLKVLIQTNVPVHKTPLHFYKGVSFPLTFNVISTGIAFEINSHVHSYTGSQFGSGFVTGVLLTPIVFYFDLGKIHKQLYPRDSLSWMHFVSVNGLTATMMRESIATSTYMGIFFSLEENWGPFVSGGIAGLASWTSTYPLDVIKTRQMKNKNLSMYDGFRLGTLWKGFGVCAIRAIVVNSVGLLAYSMAKNHLNK
jgi:solute carrier family 25 (mitochondrial carnitine/acylcarnitine transporter), member 20/29